VPPPQAGQVTLGRRCFGGRAARRSRAGLLVALALWVFACSGASGGRATGGAACRSTFPRCDDWVDCSALCACERGSKTACSAACAEPPTSSDEPPTSSDEAFEREVLQLTNDQRAHGGCCESDCFPAVAPLEMNPLLSAAARAHAADMAANAYLSHDGSDGKSPLERMSDAGFKGCAVAENVARGYPTPEAVVNAWLASREHCENLFWDQVHYLGVGHAASSDEWHDYWVQNFGG
jgi:uncharacterized protein YkwD